MSFKKKVYLVLMIISFISLLVFLGFVIAFLILGEFSSAILLFCNSLGVFIGALSFRDELKEIE